MEEKSMSEQINDILSSRVYSNSHSYSKRKNFSSSIAIEKLSADEEDQILDSYPELINDTYRGWMINKLRSIGKQAFIEKADKAMKYGKNPQRLFVSLLK